MRQNRPDRYKRQENKICVKDVTTNRRQLFIVAYNVNALRQIMSIPIIFIESS
jgi:hypothetical protein